MIKNIRKSWFLNDFTDIFKNWGGICGCYGASDLSYWWKLSGEGKVTGFRTGTVLDQNPRLLIPMRYFIKLATLNSPGF